jgi:hypothetical protein
MTPQKEEVNLGVHQIHSAVHQWEKESPGSEEMHARGACSASFSAVLTHKVIRTVVHAARRTPPHGEGDHRGCQKTCIRMPEFIFCRC